jgi:hypothetical protein
MSAHPQLVRAGLIVLLLSMRAEALPAQHVHGAATLDIGIEGKAGQATLRASGEDVYGFERAPRTPAERARQEAALKVLREQGATLIRFQPALGCSVTADAARVVSSKGGHDEVEARYRIACRQAPAGKPLAFGVSQAFRGIETVTVQLVSDTAQTSRKIVRDRGTVTP